VFSTIRASGVCCNGFGSRASPPVRTVRSRCLSTERCTSGGSFWQAPHLLYWRRAYLTGCASAASAATSTGAALARTELVLLLVDCVPWKRWTVGRAGASLVKHLWRRRIFSVIGRVHSAPGLSLVLMERSGAAGDRAAR